MFCYFFIFSINETNLHINLYILFYIHSWFPLYYYFSISFIFIADIDRTLKRVNEGIDEFDTIYENIQKVAEEQYQQKLKLEDDLKKEIKKLQKYRYVIHNF